MTPTEASWQSASRRLLSTPLSQVVADIGLNCPVPWIRRAFAAPGARPCIAKGLYRLSLDGLPYPGLALSVGRREPGKADKVAYVVYTVLPNGRVEVLGKSKIDKDRLIEMPA